MDEKWIIFHNLHGNGEKRRRKDTGMEKKKAALHNLGCKVNAYETEAMQQMLQKAGYEIVPFAPGADVYVINTCTVTNIADRKSRQMLHKAKKMNPNAVVVAAGCYVQAAREELECDSAVDIVIGNNRKKNLVDILEHYEQSAVEDSVIDINHTREYERLSVSRTAEHTRAYLKVQDGCNQFCSYCIIPYTRGRVRSRAQAEVVQEVRTLAAQGCQEVVLTGIHLSSYGMDLGTDLLQLILAIHEIDGIQRIRLGSLEPRIITEKFTETLAGLEKFCPHFHLSLQSGCDATLGRMNRRYTAEEYYEKCCLIRKYFPHPALTTDVIVGFPGETEEEFLQTRAFLDKVQFYETHIFQYSRRRGTKAAAMKNQVPPPVQHERSVCLIEDGKRRQYAFEKELVGTETEVLFEETVFAGDAAYASGHTKEYVRLLLRTDEKMDNQIAKVRVLDQRKKDCLLCEKV